jgi:hypothetical protein
MQQRVWFIIRYITYVYIYFWMYIHMFMCLYSLICVHLYIYVYVYVYVHVYQDYDVRRIVGTGVFPAVYYCGLSLICIGLAGMTFGYNPRYIWKWICIDIFIYYAYEYICVIVSTYVCMY